MNFFERLIDGLKLYEVLMLTLGSLLFLALLTLLIIFVVKERPVKPLLLYFIIAVIMLGWPSIQKIKVDGEGLELAKVLAQYENESTGENKAKVEEIVNELKDREVKDPKVVKKIAKAEFLIGQPLASLQTIESLPPSARADSSIVNLETSIRTAEALKQQLTFVQKHPDDSNAVQELNTLLYKADQLEIKNPQVDSSVNVAETKVSEYQRRHPGVEMRVRTSTILNPGN